MKGDARAFSIAGSVSLVSTDINCLMFASVMCCRS